jgi:hypothetical protein
MRVFETGATCDDDDAKPHYAGYFCPRVIRRYGQFMLKNQTQADGQKREPDNWKRGIPKEVHLDSLVRHVIDLWAEYESAGDPAIMEELACAVLFRIQGFLREIMKR